MDLDALRRYRDVRRLDLVAAVSAGVGVLALGPLGGLGLAIGLSVLGLVYRSSRVRIDALGKIQAEKASWGSIADHPERETIPGILVLRIDSPLFWVNAVTCSDEIQAIVQADPDVKVVVLSLEATTVLDTTSADMLGELVSSLHKRDIDVYMVRLRFPVRTVLRRSGVMTTIGEDHVWHSISQGVKRARKDHGITADFRPAAGYDPDAAHVPASGEDEFGHRWSPFQP